MKTNHSTGRLVLLTLGLSCTGSLPAQLPVQSFNATYVSTSSAVASYMATPAPNSGSFNGCRNQNNTYTFNNGTANALRLVDLTVNGTNFFVANNTPATVRLRRVDNAAVRGVRNIVYLETTNSPAANCPSNRRFSFKSPYADNMEAFLNTNYINQGTDNLFTNSNNGDGNQNNIERVDVLFPAGLSATNTAMAGFAFFDRGNNNGHDAFRVVAITALDAAGNPASFGPVQTAGAGNGSGNGSWGHPSVANGNRNIPAYVLRKDAAEPRLRSSASVNQQLGAVFFSLADLGVLPSQVIYGYSLLGGDGLANPTPAQLLDLNNEAVYPTNTTEAGGGGLDLVAVNAFFQAAGAPLALEDAALTAVLKQNKVLLSWTCTGLPAYSRIEVERRTAGRQAVTIYSFSSSRPDTAGAYTDSPAAGQYSYRLKIRTPDGRCFYSHTVKAVLQPGHFKAYPTLLHPSGPITVEGVADGTWKALFFTPQGLVHAAEVVVQGGAGVIRPPAAGYRKGYYYLSLVNKESREEKGLPILVQ